MYNYKYIVQFSNKGINKRNSFTRQSQRIQPLNTVTLIYKTIITAQAYFNDQFRHDIVIAQETPNGLFLSERPRTIDELEPQNIISFATKFGRFNKDRILKYNTGCGLTDVCYFLALVAV